MSDATPIHTVMAQVMQAVGSVGKNSRNADQGYAFRGVDDVVNAVAPVFREHGVVVYPVATTADHRDVTTSRNKPARECTTVVTYRFVGPAGDHIDAQVPGEAMDTGDKATPKAMSVAYRVALLQTLNLPTGETDPDASTFEREPEPANTRPDALRQEIADVAQRKGYALETIAQDFHKSMNGADIREAATPVLAEYKAQLENYPDAEQ